jgi:hypothetical protein
MPSSQVHLEAASPAATIGLVADTHGILRPGVLAALQRAQVQHILHAGDLGMEQRLRASAKRLRAAALVAALEELAPVMVRPVLRPIRQQVCPILTLHTPFTLVGVVVGGARKRRRLGLGGGRLLSGWFAHARDRHVLAPGPQDFDEPR